MGIGTTIPEYCSLYQGNHISLEDVEKLHAAGAVGDVCALYFQEDGCFSNVAFHQRRIGVLHQDLQEIESRLAVAGNPHKAEAVLGAIRGNYINALVTDNLTAIQVLKLDQGISPELPE